MQALEQLRIATDLRDGLALGKEVPGWQSGQFPSCKTGAEFIRGRLETCCPVRDAWVQNGGTREFPQENPNPGAGPRKKPQKD